MNSYLKTAAVLVILSLVSSISCNFGLRRLKIPYSWNVIEFSFPSEVQRENKIKSGEYIPGNSVAIDVDVYYKGNYPKIFVTLPRLKPGNPATLTTISRVPSPTGRTTLTAYPNYDINKEGNCGGLTSVFRVKVDSCGRLWVIDTGRTLVSSNYTQVCPAKLVAYNADTDVRLLEYQIPESQVRLDSLFITVAVDIPCGKGNCNKAFVYVADVVEYGLVVYDMQRNRSWRITHNLFYPFPTWGHFDIAGVEFDLMDGIFSLALSPDTDRNRMLFYHALASNRENWVSTKVLKNYSNFENGVNSASREFYISSGSRPSQSAAAAMDSRGVLYFGLLSDMTLNCWDSTVPYSQENLIELERDRVALQFPSGLKVTKNNLGVEEIWIMTSRFQQLMGPGYNSNEINFRIIKGSIEDLVRGTPCDVPAFNNALKRPPAGIARPIVFE